jgi:hypothetical protein
MHDPIGTINAKTMKAAPWHHADSVSPAYEQAEKKPQKKEDVGSFSDVHRIEAP